MNLNNARAMVTAYLDADQPVFCWSPPGVGKSDMVRDIATERALPLIDFRALLRDPVDMRGLPAIVGGEARWLPPSDLPNAARDGDEGILFLDELNAAPAAVQAACFGLVLDRKVGEYRLPPGWRIISAGNRQADRAAAQRMPTALANRLAHVDIEPDVDTFTNWANRNDISPIVIAFIRFRPTMLHVMAGSDLRAFPTPRSWASVSKHASAPSSLRLGLVTGLVGEGAAAEFEGFVRVYSTLPSLDQVIAHPETTPVPSEPAARFAIAAGLGRKAKTENFAAIMTYIRRLPREFEVMMAVDAVRRDAKLAETKAFQDWAVRNQDVTML
ncbi:hypothetical protein NKJ72_12115 [Mesorhizobium sp. M0045]|uniref:hypothetical protein n=1 Tax=Mesorhizobium sp. M0045 TaxID=2956857 RepID=UPI00333C4508